MSLTIKQNESIGSRRKIFVKLVDSSEVPVSGVSPTIEVSKNGASYAIASGAFTELKNGIYTYEFSVGEVNTVGILLTQFTDVSIAQHDVWVNVKEDDESSLGTALSSVSGKVDTLIAGNGANQTTITFQDADLLIPIPDVSVTIFNSEGTSVIVAQRLTDDLGQLSQNLDDGSYTVVASKTPNHPLFTPVIITVSASETDFTLSSEDIINSITVPESEDIVTVFGFTKDIMGEVLGGIKIKFKLIGNNMFNGGGSMVLPIESEAVTDSNGFFEIPLYDTNALDLDGSPEAKAQYRVEIERTGEFRKFEMPETIGDIINFNELIFIDDQII